MAAPASGGVPDDTEDYSPAATVVRFDPPLPLLRAPLPGGGEGPVLAFRDAASWQAAWEAAEASLVSQCELAESPRASDAGQYAYQLQKLNRASQLLATGDQ